LQRSIEGSKETLDAVSKWGEIAKCSQDTASRDIKDQIKRGALKQDEGGGRSTSYSLVEQ
jgi:Fic family protein